ncbi:MAG: transposase [Pseudonocardiaceae bacterium]
MAPSTILTHELKRASQYDRRPGRTRTPFSRLHGGPAQRPRFLTRFLIRHSRGAWREAKAEQLLAAAEQTLTLWGGDGMDFAELAQDIALETHQALLLGEQIADLDERIANLLDQTDPKGIVASAPGLGPVLAGAIAGRLGDPKRFRDLAAIRSYSGLVPKTNLSGLGGSQHSLTKAGDPYLREALFLAADQARRVDPQLAARYHRLTTHGKHHTSALCTVATTLLTRIASCWRTETTYQLRDTDGTPITPEQGRAICAHRYPRPPSRADQTTEGPAAKRLGEQALTCP